MYFCSFSRTLCKLVFFNEFFFFLVVVRQGETYGPKDHNCLKEVIFERKCGHQVKSIDL
jgi:hypothetical protein